MPRSACTMCGHEFAWSWSEAFDKFGFADGDGNVMTDDAADVLTEAGYVVDVMGWGFHNTVIRSIQKDGAELIPPDTDVGYDDPRGYLPADLVALLDDKLPD